MKDRVFLEVYHLKGRRALPSQLNPWVAFFILTLTTVLISIDESSSRASLGNFTLFKLASLLPSRSEFAARKPCKLALGLHSLTLET